MKKILGVVVCALTLGMSYQLYAQGQQQEASTGSQTAAVEQTNPATQSPPQSGGSVESVTGSTTQISSAPESSQPSSQQKNETRQVIEFSGAPLTSVIDNLARLAGINYILDYKVPYGQVGPDGQPLPQPVLTVRWEGVTPEQALLAVLNNYDLQLVMDPKTQIARITKKDPAAPDPLFTKVIQLKYAGVSNMINAVQTVLTDKRSKVVADPRTAQLIVTATEKELTAVEELVQRLDTPTRQVLIEAHIIETGKNPQSIKGIDWSGTLEGQQFTFGNATMDVSNSISTLTIPGTGGRRYDRSTAAVYLPGIGLSLNTRSGFTPDIGFLNAQGVNAILSMLNKDNETRVISTPRAVTLDNQPAELSVTRTYPIFQITPGTVQVAGGSQVEYTNVGTVLIVTPRISANDYIWLHLRPEVSSWAGIAKRVVGDQVYEADIFDFRKIETQVLIPSGNTLVMGGLISDAMGNQYSKVPLLGDLPLIGLAFRHESKSTSRKNLLIFVTPTIIKDTDFRPATTDFLQTPIPDTSAKEPSFWDSAKPYDWSDVPKY